MLMKSLYEIPFKIKQKYTQSSDQVAKYVSSTLNKGSTSEVLKVNFWKVHTVL